MMEPTIESVNLIFQKHLINIEIVSFQILSGTTSGLVLRLKSRDGNRYILKFDTPNQIELVEELLIIYKDSVLLPNVLLSAQDKSYFAYTYIEGTTHFNRGPKINWMKLLVRDLLNRYVEQKGPSTWGRIEWPRETWKEFNEISIKEAQMNLKNVLSLEDYNYVKLLAEKLFNDESKQGKKYLLHGDTGVHNFVYNNSTLIGVIDPSPMVGPIIYDFLYAFCSSPDDINTTTLFAAADLLEQGHVERTRMVEETLIHLYCRVGLSVLHHPHDLPDYLQAWGQWKQLCKNIEEGIVII
ncbi:phosphotransferase [Paenibacillus sanfengchensis]|uniref:phosphotransferase n=1 Tax=Paenibacillus sanfengchensis TaxID=3119819 RepID=UPI002FE24F85